MNEKARQAAITAVYDKLHENKLGAHWLWCVIEKIAAGESEEEAMREYGYYVRAALAAQPGSVGEPWHNPVATAVRDGMTGQVQLEYIGHFPADELVRLYAAPQPHHIDLLNVAVAVRDACHRVWVTGAENWRADVDVRQIVRDTATQHTAPALSDAWQPIETAPKDGTAILVSEGRFIHCVEWNDEYEWWAVDDNKFGPFRLRGTAPTHWMRLPPPPSVRAAAALVGEAKP